jgi:hypothetical protein
MPIERRDVWRNLPAAVRRAIVDDLAAVLREVNDEIGLSSEASRSQSGQMAGFDRTSERRRAPQDPPEHRATKDCSARL